MLDVEESMLDYSAEERERVRAGGNAMVPRGRLRAPAAGAASPSTPTPPASAATACAIGTTWVHLRMCVICGHIACCDSSPERHASAHHAETGHEVMRSAEAGEDWRWCFVDQLTG